MKEKVENIENIMRYIYVCSSDLAMNTESSKGLTIQFQIKRH